LKESKEVSGQLGTLEELPQDYREAMARTSIHDAPLQEKLGYYEERVR
jgi:hypothetical protein